MKVFISWSGTTSHKVAVVLRDWLPSVVQSIQPYVSSEDIDKGARWSTDIAGELDASAYGILCLTKSNINAPWINFEAGALGKSVEKSRVSPFLFRIKRSEVEGPVLQFQSTVFEREDVLKLLKSINQACGAEALEEARLEKVFDVWWPQLERELAAIPEEEATADEVQQEPEEASKNARVLEEILELTRNNHKILRDPMSLIPMDYFEHVLSRSSRRRADDFVHPSAIEDLVIRYREVLKFVSKARGDLTRHPAFVELFELIDEMDGPLRFISSNIGMRLPRDVLIEKKDL